MKVRIESAFHPTSYEAEVTGPGEFDIEAASRAICGMPDCSCGGLQRCSFRVDGEPVSRLDFLDAVMSGGEEDGAPEEAIVSRAAREQILVEFTPGVRGWFEPVEILSDEYCVIEWNQPGAGLVRGCVARMDVQTEAGEFIWQWDGTFEPVEEEQQAATGQEAEVFAGFVVSESGAYFVQLPQDNEFGFSLFDADQSWPGGIGAARTWTAVARESVPAEAERALGWILDGVQPVG